VSPQTDPLSRAAAGDPLHRRLTRIVPTDETHGVTTLELFFDLVFVFAITQITAFMAADLGWQGCLRGLVLLSLLWFAWCSYSWLGNQARADEGILRGAYIVAMAAMFAVGLAIPEAWGDEGGGLSAPVLLAAGLAVVRLTHLAVYVVAAAGDVGLRRQVMRTAIPVGISAALLLVGAVLGAREQTACWTLALIVDYAGI
jgi:low temperature requirement protein LtrA